MKLVLEFATPNRFTSCTFTFWIPSLYHEVFNHSVEKQMVIIFISSMNDKILNRLWNKLRIKLNEDISHGSLYHHLTWQFNLHPIFQHILFFSCRPLIKYISLCDLALDLLWHPFCEDVETVLFKGTCEE